MTPGQAAYEAFWANRPPVIGTATAIPADWDSERPAVRDQWEAAAQAATDGLTGRVAELIGDVNRLTAERDELSARLADAVSPTAADYDNAAEILRLRAERDRLRAGLERLLAATEHEPDDSEFAGLVCDIARDALGSDWEGR